MNSTNAEAARHRADLARERLDSHESTCGRCDAGVECARGLDLLRALRAAEKQVPPDAEGFVTFSRVQL